jgi:hypothetical protein
MGGVLDELHCSTKSLVFDVVVVLVLARGLPTHWLEDQFKNTLGATSFDMASRVDTAL